MKRIILLDGRRYPSTFSSVDVTPPKGISKINYLETEIINSFNKYNPKLRVSNIEYLRIRDQFPSFIESRSNGLLVEEFEIKAVNRTKYTRNGCYVTVDGNRHICRRILMYLFISPTVEGTRTAFVSQTVFPTLLDYARDFIQSPSYSFANHKFCFINILNKRLNANMILRHIASLCVTEMDYVEVFNNNSLNISTIPKDLKSFLTNYSSFSTHYNQQSDVYENDSYKIDFKNKIFRWKTDKMIGDLITDPSNQLVKFNGSNEKFYWIEVLPMAIFAYNQGYNIDYSNYENFIINYRGRFSNRSDKFERCEVLLSYIKKYFN